MRRSRVWGAALAATLLGGAGGLDAQEAALERPAAEAFGYEWAGAAATSFVVSGLYLAAFEEGACGDDLGCTFEALGGLAFLSTAASVVGVHLADRIAGTEPSLWGAGVGAVAGTVGGFLLVSHGGADRNDFTRALALGLTQGLGAALGSRLGAALR